MPGDQRPGLGPVLLLGSALPADLERQLQAASDARFRMIATDGVFSMDGIIANLADICALADTYDAMVMVDDSHAAGFMGPGGRGTPGLGGGFLAVLIARETSPRWRASITR